MAWSISNAMMKAYENSRCSQALAAASSEATCSDGAPSAPSNTTPMPDQYYWPDKTTEHSRLSRFGMTCEPLTASHGEELLTWFRAGFPARTLALQEMERDLTASAADCGQKWRASLARYDPATHSLKTAQCSLIEDLTGCSATLPRWGSMRNGACYLRPIPALPICANASGSWPTPKARDAQAEGLQAGIRRMEKYSTCGLATAVQVWPTPTANMHTGAGSSGRMGGLNLQTAVARNWPTPCASMSKGSSEASLTRKSGADRSNDRLDHAVMASDRGQLNPRWVEWLMGWPIGLTSLKPLETAKFREWRQQHGKSLQENNQ